MHCSPSKPIAVQQHKIGKSRPHTAARVSGGYPVSCARSRSAIVRGDRRGMRPNAWCFFCPLRFPTTSTRRHLEKSRREKSCAHARGFADFYQRFFFGGRARGGGLQALPGCRAARIPMCALTSYPPRGGVGRHEELTPWRQQELTRCRKFSTGVFDGRGSTQVSPSAVGRTAEGGDVRAGGGIGPAPVEGAGFWYASHCAHAWDQSQHGQELHRGRRLEDLQ